MKKSITRLNSSESLSLRNFERLNSIFDQKHWNISDNPDGIYNRYIRTLLKMTPKEQSLFLNMTERFQDFTMQDCISDFVSVIKDVFSDYEGYIIYCFRCVNENDQGKTKSSSFLLYLLKGPEIKDIQPSSIKLSVIDDPSSLKGVKLVKKSLFLLIDDFVGTGETVREALEYILKSSGKSQEGLEIAIASVVMMKQGYDFVRRLGIKPFHKVKLKRGISDYFKGDGLKAALRTIDSIESKIKGLNDEFRHGYHQSEALVKLTRCPNNTFPVYWLPSKDAPYAR